MISTKEIEDSFAYWRYKQKSMLKYANPKRTYERPWTAGMPDEEKIRQRRLKKLEKQRMEQKYKKYVATISDLNQKKAFLSTYRKTMPVEERQFLIDEIKEIQTGVERDEKEMYAFKM